MDTRCATARIERSPRRRRGSSARATKAAWASLGALAIAAIAAGRASAAEVRVERGLGGVVPASGTDLVAVTVESDRAARVVVRVGDGDAVLAIPAGGAATARFGRDAGKVGVVDEGPVSVQVAGETIFWRGEAPAARRVARPVLVVAVDADAAFAAYGPSEGEPVAISIDRLPPEWPAYDGFAAVVLDAPSAARLGAAERRALARYVARGGATCVFDAGRVDCARGDPLPVPAELPPSAAGVVPAALARWALAALVAAALVAASLARRLRPLCVAAPLALAAAPLSWSAPPELRASGLRVEAGQEELIVGRATVVAPLGGSVALDAGAWWIRGDGAFAPLEAARWPDRGVWRVDGFVPRGGAGRFAALPAVSRPAVALPW